MDLSLLKSKFSIIFCKDILLFDRQYTNFFSWHNSHYEIKGSTYNLYVEIQYSYKMCCRKSCFENKFLTDNFNGTLYHLS